MFKDAGITFFSKVLVALINFGIIVLLSRLLGPDGKGQCSLYLVIFSTTLIICECISGSTVVYLLSRYRHRQLLGIFYVWSIPCAVLIGLVFQWMGKVGTAELWLIILLNWLNAATSFNQSIALGKQRIGLFNGLNILQAGLSIAAAFWLLNHWQRSPVGYLVSLCVALGICFVVGLVPILSMADEKPKAHWKALVKDGFRSGIANQASTLIQLVNTRLGYLLLPVERLGIYSNAVSICEGALLLSSSIGSVQYARIVREKDRPEQVRITHSCFWMNALFMFLGLTVLFLLPASVYGWAFGAAFEDMQLPVRMLIPGIWAYSGFVVFSYFNSGTGRFLTNSFPAMAGLLVTLLGFGTASVLGIVIGMETIALILVLSYITLFITALAIFLKHEQQPLRHWMRPPALKDLIHL